MARAFSMGTRTPTSSNTTQSGIPQGTMGGTVKAASSRPGRSLLNVGDEMYLWGLLALEVIAMGILRNHFRRYHGG